MAKPPPNIIIKRITRVAAEGHHGGAWKVAYADFVTAMMAFFLLMWLLNATTEDQRKGIADYFDPKVPISQISGGGDGALSGTSVFSDNIFAKDGAGQESALSGRAPEGTTEKTSDAKANAEAEERAREEARLQEIQQGLLAKALEADSSSLMKHIQTRLTPDGLVIELVDLDGAALFEVGSAQPSPTLVSLLDVVASVIGEVKNDLAIVGHTDGRPYSGARDYTNWELSTDRANTARRLMVRAGLAIQQVAEVSGKADTEPLMGDPFAAQNRRISVTLLRE